MRGCEWCAYEETEWLLYQSLHWSVYLADRQDYVGRCILVLNRHCGSLSELDVPEWLELKTIMGRLEWICKEVLGAELCNWSCLLNNFYKEAVPNPHLHIHVYTCFGHTKKQPSQRVRLLFAVTVEFKDCGTMRLPCRAR